MRNGVFAVGLAIAALSPPAAVAQQAAGEEAGQRKQDTDDAIVVTGTREVTAQTAQRYVRGISSTTDGQLSRFIDPVCPVVSGFDPANNQIIADRIRQFAASARVPVAKTECDPNLAVIVTEDSDGFVTDLHAREPRLFDGLSDAARARAFRSGPVHAWNNTQLLNEDGQPMVGGIMTVKSASIMELPTQRATIGATIVIDQDVTIGKTLRQIADYAAMRALGGARPPNQGVAVDTILSLFDAGGTPPLAATRLDQSYLAGVYASRPTAKAVSAMSRISGGIVRDEKARKDGD